MASKKSRQARIVDLLRTYPVSRQSELSRLLDRDGVRVTQPTLSRDIRELGLVKACGFYRIPEQPLAEVAAAIRSPLQQLVVESGLSRNIVMVKTHAGSAPALGAVLDSARWPEVLGTVAGDDTVFVLLTDKRHGRRVLRRIQECSA